jgi:hypothetical protein
MINLLVILLVFGVALYLISLIPMDATVKRIIMAIAILFLVLYALQVLGIWSGNLNVKR